MVDKTCMDIGLYIECARYFSYVCPQNLDSAVNKKAILMKLSVWIEVYMGKMQTISYLFPLIANLRIHKKKGGIKAVIISPTRELARQVNLISNILI